MKMVSGRRTPRPRRWRGKNGLMVPTAEAVAEALDGIPAEPPWAWAALRVMPRIPGDVVRLLEGQDLEELDDLGFRPLLEFPTVHVEPGIDVAFAIEADVVHVKVGQADLDRWDMQVADVMPAALANLRRAVGTWTATMKEDEYEGVPVRMLEEWPHWAVTLLLLPEELKRVFGSHDHVFVAPYTCNLVSLPADVDRDIAADISTCSERSARDRCFADCRHSCCGMACCRRKSCLGGLTFPTGSPTTRRTKHALRRPDRPATRPTGRDRPT